jgi:hypothetical protein
MTFRHSSTRPQIERQLDAELTRSNLRCQDYVVTLACLACCDLAAEPEAMNLICEVVTLRAGRAPEYELQSWGTRARKYLHSLLEADEPTAPRSLN